MLNGNVLGVAAAPVGATLDPAVTRAEAFADLGCRTSS